MRVYVDTSVFGGVFDKEFSRASLVFFDEARGGKFRVVVSDVVLDELRHAPDEVQAVLDGLEAHTETVEISEESLRLVRAYLAAGVVTEKWRADALHVAVAVVSGCRAIVSWNFRHIVHFEKIPLYNGVNQSQGFGTIAIHTPQEVVSYVDEEQVL